MKELMLLYKLNPIVALLLVVLLCSCARNTAAGSEPAHTLGSGLAPASNQGNSSILEEPYASLNGLFFDVWGGDGDNLPALWSQVIHVTVHNPTDTSFKVTKVSWKVEEVPRLIKEKEIDIDIKPENEADFTVSKRLTYYELDELRKYDVVRIIVEITLLGAGGTKRITAERRMAHEFCF